jgi:hypothetical protein
MRTMMFQSHEMMDHPLGIVYAIDALCVDISLAVLDIIAPHLDQATDNRALPRAMAQRAMMPFWDKDFPRHLVLVVDAQRGSLSGEELKAKAEAATKALIGAIPGANAPRTSALVINSGTGAADEAGTAVDWPAYRFCSLPSRGVSDADTVVPTAGEPLEHPTFTLDDGPALGCWISQKNLDDAKTLVSSIIRTF